MKVERELFDLLDGALPDFFFFWVVARQRFRFRPALDLILGCPLLKTPQLGHTLLLLLLAAEISPLNPDSMPARTTSRHLEPLAALAG